MTITQEIFEAFLRCPTKAYLIAHHVEAERVPLDPQVVETDEAYRKEGLSRICSGVPADETLIDAPTLNDLKRRRYQLIVNCSLITPSLEAGIHGLHLPTRDKPNTRGFYIPFRFVSTEKVPVIAKMLLAFDAFVLSEVSRTAVPVGEVIHGREYASTVVPLAASYSKMRSALGRIAELLANASPPPLILNKHCAECQFVQRCARIAKEKDDLSLLSKMGEKERLRYHQKGIFTVTQLSYTYRHRRRTSQKHDHALKALAVRKNQVHITGSIVLRTFGTPVYMDVEGDADRDFYYCIGIRFEPDGVVVQTSFWADDPSDEGRMWTECLATLSTINNAQLVHYGSYEGTFLRQMKKRYPTAGPANLLDQLMESAVNLLAIIYAQVYFPTYSNGLKDIAQHLGFSWSEPDASGLMALRWRREWDRSREPALKQRLIKYNAEDCAAAEIVAQALSSLSAPSANVVDAETVKREYPQRFGEIDFVLPEFRQINEAARWDYQREKVYLRSRLPRTRSRLKTPTGRVSPRARVVNVKEERPTCCVACGSTAIKRWGRLARVVHDLKVTGTGIKRWVVRYSFPRYICWQCRKTFHKFASDGGKYGATIRAYVVYQVIELQLSQRAVAGSLAQIFSLPVSPEMVNRLKSDSATRYTEVYKALLDKIVRGPVVHADETKATILGKQAYVWVFANSEDVAYLFSESRDASTPERVLKGFGGVLVSDFYTGYDSIACPQQKCLIHLMRDINEDLCKQPFNEEMKHIAQLFAELLQPIVASVDRFGLKARHLRKHEPTVKRFYKALLRRTYQTEVAAAYQRRFEKNRDRLFVFLNNDGVPWNNNNAEHAIKAFARLRNIIGGTSTAKGLHEYLIMLSISETCKNKGARFLDFLLSQECDVDRFASRSRRIRGAP